MFEVLGLTEQMSTGARFRKAWISTTPSPARPSSIMKIDKRFHDKYHAPYGVIHRADLLNVILDACRNEPDQARHLAEGGRD